MRVGACWVFERVFLRSPDKGFWACLGDEIPGSQLSFSLQTMLVVLLNSFEVEDGLQGIYWTCLERVWMEDDSGVEWFRHVFVNNCGPQLPQLLLLDSHWSQKSLQS